MKVFIIGLPHTGSTKIARSLSDLTGFHYVSATAWLESTFRPPHKGEKKDDYEQAFQSFYSERLKLNPSLCIDNMIDSMLAVEQENFIIDGIQNPSDFTYCFDYNTDVAIFLNRTDAPQSPKDHEGVSVNVMRDCCLYQALMGLLPRERWLEYNYKIPGEESDFVKETGKHNSVFIIKSLNKVIEHIKGKLCALTNS